MGDDSTAALGALRVDEEKLKGHVGEVVRSSVEETLETKAGDVTLRVPKLRRLATPHRAP